MWVLDCDNPDIFKGKQPWLRPGTEYLIGRNKPTATVKNQRYGVIDHKSVSRAHLILKVEEPAAGSGSQVFAKSLLTITDNSKIGTTIDGAEKFKKDHRVLSGTRHELQLGNWPHKIIVEWRPKVFSITNVSRQDKQSDDPLRAVRQRIEKLGLKFSQEYLPGQTTHVVAIKRNLAYVLTGLITGKFIVTDDFFGAIEERCISTAREDDTTAPEFSSLEEDVKNWPDELSFVPKEGNEPVKRPASWFAPRADRAGVFAGYTFIFCDKSQFENLLVPISHGGGKALYYDSFVHGQTSVNEFVAYTKNVAGEKGLGEFEDGSEGKGVVVVRLARKKDQDEAWTVQFIREADRALGQRSIDQNEFLDAILNANAAVLRQPLQEEVEPTSSAPQEPSLSSPPKVSTVSLEQPVEEQPAPSIGARRRTRQAITQSRFRGFDDFDPSQITKPVQPLIEDEEMTVEGVPPISQVEADDSLQGSSQKEQRDGSAKRKRQSGEEEPDDGIDSLFPAAAAMKRRRMETGQDGTRATSTAAEETTTGRKAKTRKKSPVVDVIEVARQQREAAEEAARKDAEALQELIQDPEISRLRNLAVIEEMDVKPRPASRSISKSVSQSMADGGSGRWKEEWAGRKNFKKFRHKGESQSDGQQPIRGHRVIVPLEEVRKKGYGMGEEYWLGSASASRQESRAEHSTRRGRVKDDNDNADSADDGSQFKRTRKLNVQLPETTQDQTMRNATPEVSIREPTHDTPAEETARENTSAAPAGSSRATQQTQSKSAGKRKATAEPAARKPPPPKKTRATPAAAQARNDDSESDEDGLRFKFRKRRA